MCVRALKIGAALIAAACLVALLLYSCSRETDAKIAVLMYHHIAENGDDSVTVSKNKLFEDLSYISENGFETVSIDELTDFVFGNGKLPKRAVMIVFDDGYRSNYTLAYPMLDNFGMKAAISVIGKRMGGGEEPLPHISWDEALEMERSGLVTVISHSYNMHSGADGSRFAVSALEGEGLAAFAEAFKADCKQMNSLIRSNLGHKPSAFAYPHGIWNDTAEKVLSDLGISVTFTTEAGINTVKKGCPETLRLLKRYNINESVDISKILER